MSVISLALQDAYLTTHYEVHHPQRVFTLVIGQRSLALHRLHQEHSTSGSAYLTAWNPFGNELSRETNNARQEKLLHDLRRLCAICISGKGVDPSGKWSGEESVLALGLLRSHAIELGERYQQNAIVWIGSDAIPELILLR